MQNMRIGVDVSSAPVAVKSSNPDPLPSWNTHTIAPNVAVSDSRFSTIAFTGTSRLPNIRNSSTNVVAATMSPAIGSRSKIADWQSTSDAAPPPTTTSDGASGERSDRTSASPPGEIGSTSGTTENGVPPAQLKRAAADAGGNSSSQSR